MCSCSSTKFCVTSIFFKFLFCDQPLADINILVEVSLIIYLFTFSAVLFTAYKVYLWNTKTNAISEGQDYPVSNLRHSHQSCVWNDDTLIFGGGYNNSDNVLYKYSISDGFVPFSTHGESGIRYSFVMIAVPSNEFSCPSQDELLAYKEKMLK
jgi:hypothetical protein